MYLVNTFSLQSAQTIFIAVNRYRTGQGLVGPMDGVNVIFTTPGLEVFQQNLPYTAIVVYYNGIALTLLSDYTIAESGGPGTGYNTVILHFAPESTDFLSATYVLT